MTPVLDSQPPPSARMPGAVQNLSQDDAMAELLKNLGLKRSDKQNAAMQEQYEEMGIYLRKIEEWKSATKDLVDCACDIKAFSPSAVHTCPKHTPAKDQRDFDRVRTQASWQIEMVYEQPLLCYKADTKEFVTVKVLNGFRTHSDYKFVAISHLWPKPMDAKQEMMDSQPDASPDNLAHTYYQYNTKKIEFNKGKTPDNWVREKVAHVEKAIESLYTEENPCLEAGKVLVWLDLVSVNQADPFAIRDATYAMSIAYHISDLTLVLLDENDLDAKRWLSRRWTLQELELAHKIWLMKSDYSLCGTLDDVEKARKLRGIHTLRTALQMSVQRESYYPQDIVYAVRGLVPPLFSLPVVYDIDLFTLILRAATVCAKKGDYSLLGADSSGLPAGSLILPFWKEIENNEVSNFSQVSSGIRVAPLANLTGCGLIFERQKTAKLTQSNVNELNADRMKRCAEFTKFVENDGGKQAAESVKNFGNWIRDDFGASNISIACRDALAAIAKGICDVWEHEHCEAFDKNTAEVCESMFGTKKAYEESGKKLKELLSLLVLAHPRHPLAVKHKRTQYITWVLRSEITKYEFIEKGIAFIKSLFEGEGKELYANQFVMVMRGDKNDDALKFISFPDRKDERGWIVISESEGVSYADSAAVVDFKGTLTTRVRTQRGVALMVQATKCTQVNPDDVANQFEVFGLNIKRLLELLVDNGAGQKSPVVLA
ncbi:hypothetical protein BC830DRAFT_1109278 [Chytriomyces sp. MP71]|nr:hypothetical protein BC830DRAFT_1109278 [Chytriomyces sp. MP71]